MDGFFVILVVITLILHTIFIVNIILEDNEWKIKKEKYGMAFLANIFSTTVILSLYGDKLIDFFKKLLS